jgi:integrase
MKLRQYASQVFRFAIVNQCGDTDPAMLLKGAIHALPTRHSKPLPRNRIKALSEALAVDMGYRETAIVINLLLLLFVRSVELREAEWSEFDLDAAEWRIPATRMKMRSPHFVPLSAQAVALLRELHHRTGRGRYLFPNVRRRGACMSASTLNAALDRMGFKGEFSVHGFRATASTLLNEMGYRPDVIERQLAHKPRDAVRASYNQAEYLDDRRQMMQQWADVVDQLAAGDKRVLTGRFSKAA